MIHAVHNGNNVIWYYPLPKITDLLALLQKCKIFFSLDLRSGYHHIGLTPEAKLKMAFSTTNGKCHWNIAPFRICSLPDIFCCLMSQILSALNFCFTYLDDILIYSSSWKEHLQHVEIIFNCLKLAKLKIKFSKCQFFKEHLYYLGHITSEQGIQQLPEKVIAITNSKEPNSMDEFCHFLGLTSYYRWFIPLFADITKPLNKLLRKNTKF